MFLMRTLFLDGLLFWRIVLFWRIDSTSQRETGRRAVASAADVQQRAGLAGQVSAFAPFGLAGAKTQASWAAASAETSGRAGGATFPRLSRRAFVRSQATSSGSVLGLSFLSGSYGVAPPNPLQAAEKHRTFTIPRTDRGLHGKHWRATLPQGRTRRSSARRTRWSSGCCPSCPRSHSALRWANG